MKGLKHSCTDYANIQYFVCYTNEEANDVDDLPHVYGFM